VDHVAALTKTTQVAQPVVGRIMIEVRSGKHDPSRSQAHHLFQVGPTSNAPTSIAPYLPCLIVPSPVRQAAHSGAMRSAAPLAHAAGTLEAHPPAELTPMSRIQIAEFSTDRHASRDVAHCGNKWLQDIVAAGKSGDKTGRRACDAPSASPQEEFAARYHIPLRHAARLGTGPH
jgi:hypothetical protein